MGLLDYYRQFQGMSEEEISADLRLRADERKRKALARVEPLDLSATTWPGLPHPNVVAAVTYAARRGLNRYPDPEATTLRREIARRHDVAPEQVVVGNGAAQLLGAAAQALLGPEQELVTPWPSYPLYPLLAGRCGARAIPVPGFDPEALLGAVGERTRLLVICNPNDPTGAHLPAPALDALLARLPAHVSVLLDEALADAVAAEPPDAALALLERHPRLIVFRSFSKLWGLAGLRCGYAIGAPSAGELLDRLRPALGVGELAQAGALEALRTGAEQHQERRATVIRERGRLLERLRTMAVDVAASEANVVWLAAPGLDGTQLAERLRRAAVIVRPGGQLGAPERIRVAVQDAAATDRFLSALERAL